MTNTLRRAAMALLFILAVAGWAVAGNVLIRVLPNAEAPNSATVEAVVRRYIDAEVRAEESGDYGSVEILLTGSALEHEKAMAAAGADPLKDLKISAPVSVRTLWRSGDRAMVEADYEITYSAVKTPIGQHFQIVYVPDGGIDGAGAWKIESIWRIMPSSDEPLVPVDEFAVPAESPAPTSAP